MTLRERQQAEPFGTSGRTHSLLLMREETSLPERRHNARPVPLVLLAVRRRDQILIFTDDGFRLESATSRCNTV
jgi:hypothetical protein